MTDKAIRLAKELQTVIEKLYPNSKSGICYLLGHCLNEIFLANNFNSRKVTGKLALLNKSGKNKYIQYGRFPKLKGQLEGNYHTWCEIEIEGVIYIADTSLKYNLDFLRTERSIKIDEKIPPLLFSNTKSNYFYKYVEDESKEVQSMEFLNKISDIYLEEIINEVIL